MAGLPVVAVKLQRQTGLSSGRSPVFASDLVAVFPDEDKPLYVVCERGGPKRQRDTKWQNYAALTQDFYFVVPNTRVQSQMLSEITRWILRTEHSVTVCVCNLSALTTGEASLWTVEEQIAWGRRWESCNGGRQRVLNRCIASRGSPP